MGAGVVSPGSASRQGKIVGVVAATAWGPATAVAAAAAALPGKSAVLPKDAPIRLWDVVLEASAGSAVAPMNRAARWTPLTDADPVFAVQGTAANPAAAPVNLA